MARARRLAAVALGSTSPNPPVGAVIMAADASLVGQGYTQPAGQAHAEIIALRAAGDRARGGTAVVTLEPCNHTGRTGPCVDALLEAGVARVVYAVADPDPVAHGGAARLRASGVDVVAGLDADATRTGALRWWLRSVQLGRPVVVWKFASTLDGRIAAADGTSKWITSKPARIDSQRWRRTVDAIIAGSGTVLADDPALTARTDDGRLEDRQPVRVVLDRRGRVPADARVLDDAAPTLVLDEPEPAEVLAVLHERGIRAVLLEGGAELAGSFLRAGCIDEVVGYLAPKLLGAGSAVLGAAGIATVADATQLAITSVDTVGPDLRIEATVVY